jgi:ferric-dicitrate binding protein FerR (iron transport regulator)
MTGPDDREAQLLAKFLSGDLSPEEDADLAERFRDDAGLRSRARALLRIDELASRNFTKERGLPAFTAALARRMQDEDPVSLSARGGSGVSAVVRSVVTRGLKRSKRRSFQRALWMGLAACLVVAVGVWLATTGESPVQLAILADCSSDVHVVRDGRPISAHAGMAITAGDRIDIGMGTSDSAVVLYPDQTRVEALSATRLSVWDEGGAKRVKLELGKIRCVVSRQPSGKSLKLRTGHAEAEIVGTAFALQVDGIKTRLDVDEGTVALRKDHGAAVPVTTGCSVTVAAHSDIQFVQRAVFVREFDVLEFGDRTDCRLTRLPEAAGEVTAIVSQPFSSNQPSWNPESLIKLSAADESDPNGLFRIPENVALRFRIRSQKPGLCYLTLNPENRQFPNEHFYTPGDYAVDDQWREIIVRAADITPYRSEGPTRDFIPGVGIVDFGIYGFGTGEIFVDRFVVTSSR